MEEIVILGAGGFAREVYWHLQGEYNDFIFVDDITETQSIQFGHKSYSVVKDWNFVPYGISKFIIGIGNPKAKKIMVEKALLAGLRPAPTFIHPRALVQDAGIGVGGIVTPGCVVTTNVKIGDYVILNLNSTVGHDSILENYVTVNPGCSISGNAVIGEGASLGTGSVIKEKTVVHANVTVGAQSAVVSDLTEPLVYVGIPAKPLIKRV